MINVRQVKVSRIVLALAIIVGTAIGARAATATWDPNTDSGIAGYKLSYGTAPGVHTVVLDVGNVTTYQFNPPAGKTYYVVLQAYNSDGELSEKSAEVTVVIPLPTSTPAPSPVNPDLTFAQPANQSTAVNTKVSLALTASANNRGNLKFSAIGLPPGLSIDASGVISGTPTVAGTYQVTVTVTSGPNSVSRTFSWTIVNAPVQTPSPTNQPPTFAQPANQTSTVGAAVSFALVASDPQGAKLTFTATGLPQGLSINSTSGLISGAAKNAGSNQVTVTVSDGALSVSHTFTWTVSPKNGTRLIAGDEALEVGAAPALLQDHVGVSGDFDGDGRLDLATYRPSAGEWRVWTSGSKFSTPIQFVWGEEGDRPMAADYNGDRITDFAVYRPSTGTWHLTLSGTQTPLAIHWGGPEDSPVALDHDGDGKADLALIRNGGYEILLSSANYLKSVQVQ